MTDLTEAFAPFPDEDLRRGEPQLTARDGEWRPILPVPADAPEPDNALIRRYTPTGYTFTAGWRYHDAEGRLLGCVVRFDRPANGLPADKQVKPLTFCQGPNGRREWRLKGLPEPRPLYGLDRLAARPKAPVLIVEGEKTADAAAERFADHAAITSPGGSKAAGKADWSALAGRDVVIWPDMDVPGERYAQDAAELIRGAGARSIRVVSVPQAFPDGWDLADVLPEGVDEPRLRRLVAEASRPADDGPLPLFPPMPIPEPYPVEHMGPVLSRAAAAISRKVQVPEAIAAQSVLAAASLAAQAHADVMLPYGQSRPLSLYLVTVAASGDRKSTADNEALWPVRKREKALKEEYESDLKEWLIEHAAWSAEKKKVEADKKLDVHSRKDELRALGSEPARPLFPFLTAPDPTVEGLTKAWVSAPAALGIFTAEGGQFVAGHGMNPDNRLKTAAIFSEIWDGKPIKRVRAGDGVSILHGRRLALHLMVQPDAAAGFLADSLLRDQGLLSRVLVAAPDSIAGTRLYKQVTPQDDAAIRAYGARLLSILEARWPLEDGKANELAPRSLILSPEATAAWRAFYDHVERQCGRGSDLAPVQDFAAKSAEHAARIAGVLTIVNDPDAAEIDVRTMADALALTDWYLTEAIRLQRAARTDPKLLRAHHLLEWVQASGNRALSFRDILRLGPNVVRTKAAAEDAVAVLIAHGWLVETSKRPRRFRLIEGGPEA